MLYLCTLLHCSFSVQLREASSTAWAWLLMSSAPHTLTFIPAPTRPQCTTLTHSQQLSHIPCMQCQIGLFAWANQLTDLVEGLKMPQAGSEAGLWWLAHCTSHL